MFLLYATPTFAVAEVLRRAGRAGEAGDLDGLAAAIRADLDRHLVRDGTLAGALWYLHFRTARQLPDDAARVRAGAGARHSRNNEPALPIGEDEEEE